MAPWSSRVHDSRDQTRHLNLAVPPFTRLPIIIILLKTIIKNVVTLLKVKFLSLQLALEKLHIKRKGIYLWKEQILQLHKKFLCSSLYFLFFALCSSPPHS